MYPVYTTRLLSFYPWTLELTVDAVLVDKTRRTITCNTPFYISTCRDPSYTTRLLSLYPWNLDMPVDDVLVDKTRISPYNTLF